MTDKEAIERMERLAKGGTNFSEESNMACAIALAALREKQVAQQNAPLTCDGCMYKIREGWNYEHCVRCRWHWDDLYRRPPEQ